MDVRKRDVRWIAGGRHVGDDMGEAVAADVEVALPAVGADLTAAGDVVEHKFGQSVLGDVGDPPDPDPLRRLVALDRDAMIALPASCRPPTPPRLRRAPI